MKSAATSSSWNDLIGTVQWVCHALSMRIRGRRLPLVVYWRAEKACDHERYNRVEAAGEEWQKVFGTQVPGTV